MEKKTPLTFCAQGKQKKIPIGINCSKETYHRRQQANEGEGEVSLTSKYQLLPADYSPPTLPRTRENFSAISGPALPSGPHLPAGPWSQATTDNDSDSDDSTISAEEPERSNYSAFRQDSFSSTFSELFKRQL